MTRPKTTWKTAPPAARYFARFGAGMAIYLIGLFVVVPMTRGGASAASWLPALLLIPGVIVIAWAVIRFYIEADEMGKKELGESFAWAFGIGTPIVCTIGILEAFGMPQLSNMVSFVIFMAAWLVGSIIARVRYH